jgi:hypothetical protein
MSLSVESTDPITLIVDQGRGPQGPPGPAGTDGVVVGLGGVTHEEFDAHVSSEDPHPVYDNGGSFTLLYLNAKV